MGCFYCDEHHEGREAIMFKVGEMKAGVLYLFKDQAHKGRCAAAAPAPGQAMPANRAGKGGVSSFFIGLSRLRLG